MASEIRVTSAQLKSKKSELENLNNNFKSLISQLEGTAGSLKGSWEGESHDAFYAAFDRDKGQMTNFHTAIQQYCQALDSIIAQYEAAEQQNTSIATTRSY